MNEGNTYWTVVYNKLTTNISLHIFNFRVNQIRIDIIFLKIYLSGATPRHMHWRFFLTQTYPNIFIMNVLERKRQKFREDGITKLRKEEVLCEM